MLNARPVQGRFRRLRWAADAVLLAILFGVPWIRIGGEPLVLLDVPHRRFHVLGLVIFPQELYFLWLLLAILALALFFFTALAGRLWCGWACPQTVFTDLVAAIARRVEGWTRAGRPRRVALWRRVVVHALWLALAVAVGFHVVSYFVGAPELASLAARGDLARPAGGFLAAVSALAWLDFVWLRQTFCKVLCPYARFQSVLFDRDTLVVGYDARRGEPRGARHVSGAGDCVDCGLCVAVCPTGIDIRRGLQLECIACTQCIDACDGVMDRVERPRGLIAYRSQVGLAGARPARLVRPRVVVYAALLAAAALAFITALAQREVLDLEVAHNQRQLVAVAADGRASNAYQLRVTNRGRQERWVRLRLDAPAEYALVGSAGPIAVAAASDVAASVFVLRDEREERDDHEEHEARRTRGGHENELRFVLEPLDGSSAPVVRSIRFLERPGAGGAGDGH